MQMVIKIHENTKRRAFTVSRLFKKLKLLTKKTDARANTTLILLA